MANHRDHISTAGESARVSRAASELIAVLRGDARVRAAYREWWRDHKLDAVDVRDLFAVRRAVFSDKEQDLEKLGRLVSHTLRLPFSWLPLALLGDFIAASSGGRLIIEAPDVPDLSRGRSPKGGGDHIRRDVEWLYRAEIKEPKDSTYRLALEYQQGQKNQAGQVNHSVVQNAINRTKALLALLEAGAI